MKKRNSSDSRSWAGAALVWLILSLGALWFLMAQWPAVTINTSVLSLLPTQNLSHVPPELEAAFTRRLDRQIVWMVSSGETADPSLAAFWHEQLRTLPGIASVQGRMTETQQQQWLRFYYAHRNNMIDAETRQRLQEGGRAQADWVLGQVYSAFGGASGTELKHDPLLLVRGAQIALQQNAGRLQFENGWLMTRDEHGKVWYFIPGELAASSFDIQQTQALVDQLEQRRQTLLATYPKAEILARGSLFYSNYAAREAGHDISTIGTVTILGVLLLILGAFRSLRPLLLCTLSVGMGALWGTAATVFVFGELHIMTLAMSLSVVGISVDYALYYLVERSVHGQALSPWQSMHKVRPALLLALATSAMAYLLLTLAPFPGIRQLAIFACLGLCAACFTVVLWYPYLVRNMPTRQIPCVYALGYWLSLWRSSSAVRVGIPLAVCLLVAAGATQLRISDDISELQQLPAGIQAEDQAITRLTGQSMDQKWFVVHGDTAQQALERLEAFVPSLEQAKSRGELQSYRGLPLNSEHRQAEDLALLQAAEPLVRQRLADAGVTLTQADLQTTSLRPQTWLDSGASQGWRLLWLSLPDGRSGILVPVMGVKNPDALVALATPLQGVSWVDRKTSFNQLFAHYRNVLGWLLLLALGVVSLVYLLRLGWRRGLCSIVPSVLSLASALAVLSLCGHSINLFSLLALILVLGIGINYSIFFGNVRGTPLTALFAAILAMSTTLLTLGILVFSGTQAISSFGIVLSAGIFTAFLLAPLAAPEKTRKPSNA